MSMDSTRPTASSTEGEHFLCDDWFDPLENGVRTRIRGFIEELLEAELDAALGRARYERPGVVGDEFRQGRGRLASRPSGTPPFGDFRRHDSSRAARPAGDRRRQDMRMAEHDHPRLPAADETGRCLDRGGVSFRDQHAPGSPRAGGAVRRRGGEGHGQPGLAQNQRRLGRLERALACRRTHHPVDPRRHGGARASRQKGDVDLSVGRAWSCARTARRCCWRSRTWAGRAKRLGGLCSTTWSRAACGRRNSSSSMAEPASTRRSPRFGRTRRSSAALSISIATCSPMRRIGCMRRSQPITTT